MTVDSEQNTAHWSETTNCRNYEFVTHFAVTSFRNLKTTIFPSPPNNSVSWRRHFLSIPACNRQKVRIRGWGEGVQQSACSHKVQSQFQCPVFCAERIGNCVSYLDQWCTNRGRMSPWLLNFVPRHIKLVGYQYETCFVSPISLFRRLEFWKSVHP